MKTVISVSATRFGPHEARTITKSKVEALAKKVDTLAYDLKMAKEHLSLAKAALKKKLSEKNEK